MFITMVPPTSQRTSTLTTFIGQSLILEADAGGSHLACKDLHAMSGGIANGEDIVVRLPQCLASPNGIKIDTIVV